MRTKEQVIIVIDGTDDYQTAHRLLLSALGEERKERSREKEERGDDQRRKKRHWNPHWERSMEERVEGGSGGTEERENELNIEVKRRAIRGKVHCD